MMGLYLEDILLLLILTFMLIGTGIYAIELCCRFINFMWRVGRYATQLLKGKLDSVL